MAHVINRNPASHRQFARTGRLVRPTTLLVAASLVGLAGCSGDENKAELAVEDWLEENPLTVDRTVPMNTPAFTENRTPELGTVLGYHRDSEDEDDRVLAMQALLDEGLVEEQTLRAYPFEQRSWVNREQTAFLPALDPERLENSESQAIIERLNADHPGDVYLPLAGRNGTAYYPEHDSFKRFEDVEPDPEFVAAVNLEKSDDQALAELLDELADEGFLRREDKTIRSDWTGVHIGTWTGNGGFAGYEQQARLYFVRDKGKDLIVNREGSNDKRVYPHLKLATAESDELLDVQATKAGLRNTDATQITFPQQREQTPLMEISAVRDYIADLPPSNPAHQPPTELLDGSLAMDGIYQAAMTDDRLLDYEKSSMAKAFSEGPETLHLYEIVKDDAPLGPGTGLGTLRSRGDVTVTLGEWRLDRIDEVIERETEIGNRRIAKVTLRFADNPDTMPRIDTFNDLGMKTEGLPEDGAALDYECQLFREGEEFTARHCRESES